MQIFLCSFLIKLHYTKKTKELSEKAITGKYLSTTLKGVRGQLLAQGNCKPSFLNQTAWFNEKFNFQSNITYNPELKDYSQTLISLEFTVKDKKGAMQFFLPINLGEIVEMTSIAQQEYLLDGGLIACVEMSCLQKKKKVNKISRSKKDSLEKHNSNHDLANSFIKIQRVSFQDEPETTDLRATPEFHAEQSPYIQAINIQPALQRGNSNIILKQIMQQFQKEQREHEQTRQKYKIIKMKLENEYNYNRELKEKVKNLTVELQAHKQKYKSLQRQLSETENLCNALSATLSHKQTDIIELQKMQEQIKHKHIHLNKKNELFQQLQRVKSQLQWQLNNTKKQNQNMKIQLSKQYLAQTSYRNQLQLAKGQIISHKNHLKRYQEQALITKKTIQDQQSIISKLNQQINSIKRQTSKWRTQFSSQSQRKDEQINTLQQRYNSLYSRYDQIMKNQKQLPAMIQREQLQQVVKDYESKLQLREEKQIKLREHLDVLQEQIVNLQELLEEKQENEEVLLDTIKKLQKDIDIFSISNNWWAAILDQRQNDSTQASKEQQVSKLLTKNKQLIQILQKNSFTILQGEKLKVELTNLKKDHEQLNRKYQLLNDEFRDLKQKVNNLYKENKKLQDKNHRINKENQIAIKRNLWLQEEILHSKGKEKQIRKDYQIISFRLSSLQEANAKRQTQMHLLQPGFLSTIKQNSQDMLKSSYKYEIDKQQHDEKIRNNIQLQNIIFQHIKQVLYLRSSQINQIKSSIISFVQCYGQKETKKIKFNDLLKKMRSISAKIKVNLLKIGKRDVFNEFQAFAASLTTELENIC